MQIDWITVSAQIVNFLLLIWLLKRFLYQPVIRAMDRREQRIAERLNEAEEHKRAADGEAERYREQTVELEQRRDEILAEAAHEASEQKQQMLEEARTEVLETRAGWLREADQEKEEFIASLRRGASDAVQAIARKALQDLADADLEERIAHAFIERLARLDKPTRRALAAAAEPVRIESSFELDHSLRSRLTRAVHEHLAAGLDVEYSQTPDLLCGIELTSGGQRLGWNIAQFMTELAERVEETFKPMQPASEGG
jgi:F-type H+-transporting ATPase subunit b